MVDHSSHGRYYVQSWKDLDDLIGVYKTMGRLQETGPHVKWMDHACLYMHVRITRLGVTTIKDKGNRKLGATGTLRYPLPGTGNDIWAVLHDDEESVGLYMTDEMEQID